MSTEEIRLEDILALYSNTGGWYRPVWLREGQRVGEGEFPETYMIGRHGDFFAAAAPYRERPPSGFRTGSLEDTLHRALHSMQGAADVYHELRESGASNEDLLVVINRQIGYCGRFASAPHASYECEPGKFWYLGVGESHAWRSQMPKPTLQGDVTVRKARILLRILYPQVTKAGQIALL